MACDDWILPSPAAGAAVRELDRQRRVLLVQARELQTMPGTALERECQADRAAWCFEAAEDAGLVLRRLGAQRREDA